MGYCPQCGGLVKESHVTRTVFENGELFKERRHTSNCIDCDYYEPDKTREKIANVSNSKRGYG